MEELIALRKGRRDKKRKLRQNFQVCHSHIMGNQIRQWIASFTCGLCVAMAGSAFVWIAPLMIRFISPGSPVPMTTADSSWLSSVIEIPEGIFTIPAGLLADRYGRKPLLLSSAPLCLIGWILIVMTRSIVSLYVVRCVQGVVMSIAFTVGPMYLAEVADPKIRGKLSGQFQTMWYAGCLYSYLTGPYLSYDNYAYFGALLTVAFFFIFHFAPESPYYLLMAKKEGDALKAFTWLRGRSDAEREFEIVKKSVDRDMELKGSWKDLIATKTDRKSFFIVQLVCIVKYLSGMSAINMYATQTFEEEFGDILRSDEMTIIFGLILLVTALSASLVTDRVGRKPLLVISSAGSALFNLIAAIVYFLDSKTSVDATPFKWIGYVSILCFCVISNIGMGPLMQTIQAEYFPSHTRGIGGGITGVVAAFGTFVSVKQYQMVNDCFGVYMNYAIFSVVSLLGTQIFIKVIPETSGKSLGQIQESFGRKKVDEESVE